MNNSSLVPKQITDRNGITKTHWVKPDASAKSAAKIPAPDSGQKPLKTPYLDVVFRSSSISYSTVSLKDLDHDAVMAVEALVKKAATAGTMAAANVRSLVFAAFANITENDYEDFSAFNNVAVLGDSLAFCGTFTDRSVNIYTNGLDQFPGIRDFHTEATEEQKAQARALCRLTAVLPDEYLESYMGYNEFDEDDDIETHEDEDPATYYVKISPDHRDLADFVMAHPDNVDEIAALIRERGSADVGMLEQVLGHGESALREGTL